MSKNDSKDFVMMHFKISEVANGKVKLLSGSSIISKTNKTAKIDVQNDNSKDSVKTLSIQVTPTWVQSQNLLNL